MLCPRIILDIDSPLLGGFSIGITFLSETKLTKRNVQLTTQYCKFVVFILSAHMQFPSRRIRIQKIVFICSIFMASESPTSDGGCVSWLFFLCAARSSALTRLSDHQVKPPRNPISYHQIQVYNDIISTQ